MTIEVTILLSALAVAFSTYFGIYNAKRNKSKDDKQDASQLTTVIIKLENIGSGIAKIEAKMNSFESDIKEDRERIIRVEESVKQAHKRLDIYEKYKRSTDLEE